MNMLTGLLELDEADAMESKATATKQAKRVDPLEDLIEERSKVGSEQLLITAQSPVVDC